MPKRKHTKESLQPLVESSTSVSQVLDKLGLRNTGGSYRLIQQRIREYELPMDHFTGSAWSKGLTKENSEGVNKSALFNRHSDEVVFKENSGYPSSKLASRLRQLGWVDKCKICGIVDWLGQKLTFHVDHINGINGDNRLENLRFLCPNCHQQTKTWGNTNG